MNNNSQDPVLFRFFNEIGIIEQLARTKMESRMPDGMNLSQFSVLNHLVRLDGQWSPLRLANAFQVTKGAMTNTLTRLEARKLVKISPNPADGRAKIVTLTKAGRNMRDACVKSIDPMLEEIERELGSDKISRALPTIKKVREFLDEHRE
jgi:DNA-binding MarR family transcriptional regulator